MTWIEDNKGEGPWDFTVGADKLYYNEGDRISNLTDPVWKDDFLSTPVDAEPVTPTHHPYCGYWWKLSGDPVLPASGGGYIYIVDAASEIPGETTDSLIKKLKSNLTLVGYQGGQGCGAGQYWCPRGCCTDGEYVWVADFKCNRIVKQTIELVFVSEFGSWGYNDDMKFTDAADVAVDDYHLYDIDYGQNRLIKRNKLDPTNVILKIDNSTSGLASLDKPRGVITDSTHVYVTDFGNHRVVKLLKGDFSFVDKWGYGVETLENPTGIDSDGTYIYVGDGTLNRVNKIKITDHSDITIGSLTNPLDFAQIKGLGVGGGYLYVCDYGHERIQKILASDMSHVSNSPAPSGGSPYAQGDINYPMDVVVETDGSYFYVADYNQMVTKFDSDFNFVAWSGDPSGASTSGNNAYYYPTHITIDATHLYINDLYNGRIVKRLKSDLSYVSEYDFSSYTDIPGDIYALSCNSTYLYALTASGTNRIHRINFSTMTYVDSYSNSTDCYWPQGCCVEGTDLYVSEKGATTGEANIFDTGNLGGGIQDTIEDGYEDGTYILNNPYGVAVDANFVYVTDSFDPQYGLAGDVHRILKINKNTGSLVASQSTYGSGSGIALKYPTHITVDDLYIYVTEREDSKAVHVYFKSNLAWVMSDTVGAFGGYSYPWGISNHYDFD